MIRRQQRLLLSFGESPVLDLENRGSLEKQRGGQKDPWDGTKSNIGVKVVDEVEVGEESTTGDSAMDEAWEEEVEVEMDKHNTEENSDSFVTISDASFTDSELSSNSRGRLSGSAVLKIHQDEAEESSCFKSNPYFDSYQSGDFSENGKEEIKVAKEVHASSQVVLIGDPEELVEEAVKESCLPETTFPTMNCLPRPVRMFRRSMGRSGGLGGLSRSKSENNLRDLKEEKSPSSLFSSSFKNLWRKKEEEVKVMEISSPLLNRRPMVLKSQGQESLDKESLTFSSMTDLRVGRDAGSDQQRAFFQKPIFSCFMNTKERELKEEERSMPNHKTVTRPRDVKRRQRRPQQSLIQDSYQLNYSIC